MKTKTKGKHLERLILASPGIVLTQVPQAARVIKSGGKPLTIRQRGPVDFTGCYPGGRAIVFDAKESGLTHRLQTSDDHLPPHQRAELVRYGKAGAVAGLLCLRTVDDLLWWCDWRELVTPKPSVAWEDMTEIGPAGRAIPWVVIRDADRLESLIAADDAASRGGSK